MNCCWTEPEHGLLHSAFFLFFIFRIGYTEVLTEGISFLPITCLFSSCFIATLLFIFGCGFGYNTGQFLAKPNQILPQHQILRERLQKHNFSFRSICIGESSLAVTMKLHYKFVFSLVYVSILVVPELEDPLWRWSYLHYTIFSSLACGIESILGILKTGICNARLNCLSSWIEIWFFFHDW